ncbi:MAG TPA: glycosyltransferase family 4 protein [Gemmatimonadaceae bacterium]
MRIALACDWFLPRMGGIELHLRDLALAMCARGLDARVVTTTDGPAHVDGVPVHRIPTLRLPQSGVAVSPLLGRAISRAIRDEGFDLVHAHVSVVSPTAYTSAVAASRMGIPTVLTFHSMLHSASFFLGATDALLGWTDGIVLTAVSSVVARQAASWMSGASVGVLPNGVDVAFWQNAPRRRSSEDIHFVSAMRISRKKRPLELVRAFADAHRFVAGTPTMRLTIAGDGPARAPAKRLAAELGIADRVSLPGHLSRDELRALYGDADVFVLPSEREAFGIAALEARTAGLPVIAMLAGGARDFIAPGTNGLLARDHAELARIMARVALDPALREFICARNCVVPREYDWRAVVDDHLAIYRAAAALRKTPAPTAHNSPGSASAAK